MIDSKTSVSGWSDEEILKNVPLIRGYVFKSVFGDDPELCRRLLATTLGREIAEVSFVQHEREIEPLMDRRAGYLDLFAVDAEGNRYDVEVQACFHKDEWLRARHYQSLMDVDQLRKGTNAEDLRESVVIFICDFDPFGSGLKRYDCRTFCAQTGDVVPDLRSSVYLNVRGERGEVDEGLDALLKVFAGSPVDTDAFVSDILAKLRAQVANREWMEGYMTFEEEKEAYGDKREAEGRAKGRAEGLAEGRAEGRAGLLAELEAAMGPRDFEELRRLLVDDAAPCTSS